MPTLTATAFADPDLPALLHAASDAERDALGFGVIGFDAQGLVRQYNRWESQAAGLGLDRVLGQPLFTVVAPCMNNELVAGRFAAAAAAGQPLDATIAYVLTLRMRPTRVRLRLLAPAAGEGLCHVLIDRSA